MSRVVPVQSDVNANKPFFAPLGSGGGTGAAGPNLTVSTLTFPVSNQSNAGVINYSSLLCFNDTSSTAPNDIQFHYGTNYSAIPLDSISIQMNSPGGNTAVMLMAAAQDGGSYVAATNTGNTLGPLTLTGASVNMSNLIVSSINGAIPAGGSINPNPQFSTISFPLSDQSNTGVINYTSVLSFNDSTTAVKNTINFQNGNNYPGLPTDVTVIQLSAPLGSEAVTIIGAADDGSSYISATNAGSSPAPLVLSGASVSMSNLIVSSINGAVPALASTTSTLQGQMVEVRSTLGLV
jgi:hypothetical protein